MHRREREERREYLKERRRKRIPRIQNTEVPQERHFGVMENNPVMDEFDLLALQRNMRSELRDGRVKLTQAVTEGRVNLEIKGDAVTNILDQLRGKKTWSHEKELMEKEICALKDQLSKGHSNIHTKTETKEMKSQIQMLCKKLSLTLEELDAQKSHSKLLEDRIHKMQEHSTMKMEEEARYVESLQVKGSETLKKANDDLEEQICKTKDVQIKLEEVEAENEGLKNQVEAMDLEVRAVKQLQTLAEHSSKTTIQSLEVQLYEKDMAVFEARMKAEHLEADLVFEKAQVQKLQERLGEKAEALRKQKEDAKKAAERTQTYHRLQTDEHKAETRKVAFALKKAEDLLETERLCWQQEKSSLLEEMEKSRALHMAQLDEKKHNNDNLVAALKNLKQQLDNHRSEWQEEKKSLIQATEDYKKTLQDMQLQVMEAVERSQASQQAQHEEHEEETRKIATALKKAEDLLETECFCWQQEKSSLLEERRKQEEATALLADQLDEQKHENDSLVAALRSAEQELQGHQIKWQELKTSLVQTSEDLKKTLHDKEKEWGERESSIKAQLEDLLSKKKKKKNWFRKLFSSPNPRSGTLETC